MELLTNALPNIYMEKPTTRMKLDKNESTKFKKPKRGPAYLLNG